MPDKTSLYLGKYDQNLESQNALVSSPYVENIVIQEHHGIKKLFEMVLADNKIDYSNFFNDFYKILEKYKTGDNLPECYIELSTMTHSIGLHFKITSNIPSLSITTT